MVVIIRILLQVDKKEIYIIIIFRHATYTIRKTVMMVTTHCLALISYLLQGGKSRGDLEMEAGR